MIKKQLKKIWSYKNDLFFIFIFAVFAITYYDSILEKGPHSSHVWRQTDCLSLTQNYADGANFFSPEMHIQHADDILSGKSAGEFPILYYIVGKLWSMFGESYLIYRLFYLLILFAGLFSFYRSLHILLEDSYWAIIISLLLFTSPVYVFYGISFLTDVPAISFILIALHFLLRYYQNNRKRAFFISMAFFALAGLVKTSSLIAFVFIFGIFVLELISVKTLSKRKLFNHRIYEWIGLFGVLLCIFMWYSYAKYYNNVHGFKYTFNSIHPIWIISGEEIIKLFKKVKDFQSQIFFSRTILYAFLFIGVLNLTFWKKVPIFAYLANLSIIIGGITYFLLWAPLMGEHDYYYSALLILFIGILIPFIWFIKYKHSDIFKGNTIKVFIGLFLVYNFFYCVSITKLKAGVQKHNNYIMLGNSKLEDFMNWTNYDFQTNLNRFEQMRPYIRTIGIEDDDKVICISDISYNSSLYLLNQKGWTNFRNYTTTEEIERLIEKGAKYLFISNDDDLNKDFLAPFLVSEVGDYKGVKVFKLR